MRGIEPLSKAWEAAVLPLNYTRSAGRFYRRCSPAGQRKKGRLDKGKFVACVAKDALAAKKAGLIDGRQFAAVLVCSVLGNP